MEKRESPGLRTYCDRCGKSDEWSFAWNWREKGWARAERVLGGESIQRLHICPECIKPKTTEPPGMMNQNTGTVIECGYDGDKVTKTYPAY